MKFRIWVASMTTLLNCCLVFLLVAFSLVCVLMESFWYWLLFCRAFWILHLDWISWMCSCHLCENVLSMFLQITTIDSNYLMCLINCTLWIRGLKLRGCA
jgi:hypothetical protein